MTDRWFYKCNGVTSGPVSLGELRRLAASGGLAPQDEIFGEGRMISWIPAGSMKILFEAATTAQADSALASSATGAAKAPVPARTSGPERSTPASRPQEPLIPRSRQTPAPPPAGAAPTTPSNAAISPDVRKPLQPFGVGLALCLFFPLGFILLARHPTLRNRKAWWGAGIAWALLVMLTPRLESGPAPPDPPPDPESITAPPDGGSRSVAPRPRGTRSVGETFTLGEFKYCITGVNTTTRIGKAVFGEFMGEQAAPGSVFVIVSYSIENIGSESQTVLSDDFKIQDSKNRTFKPSSDANVALLMESEDKDFLLSELQPGLPRAMKQAFQLPEKALESPIMVIVPKKGLFVSGEERVHVPLH